MAEEIRGSYKDIADAIRARKGSENEMTPAEMPDEIATIPGIVPSGTLSITENGTGIDVTEYAEVDVDVQGGGSLGSGIWWIGDPGYEPVNLATSEYAGWYDISTWSGSGSNPPEKHEFESGEWYYCEGSGFSSGEYLSSGYAYVCHGSSFSSGGIDVEEANEWGKLIGTAYGGCGTINLEELRDKNSGDVIKLIEFSVGESATFDLTWGEPGGSGGEGTFTITRTH